MVLQEKAAGVEEEEVAEGQLLVARAAGHRRKMGSSRLLGRRWLACRRRRAPPSGHHQAVLWEPVVKVKLLQRAACRHCAGVGLEEQPGDDVHSSAQMRT